MLENKTFDICHIHNINFHLSFSIISEIKKKNIPIVMTTHDYSIIGPNYNRNKRWNPFHFKNIILIKEFIFRKIFFSFKKNIDAFICPSKFIKNQLESRGFKNLHVIYNFTNISSKEQNSQTDDYFLYFGRLSKEKGLVEFIKILKDLNGDFQFYIVGDGDQRSKIEKLIHKLNFENKIKLLGYKPQDQLFKIIEKAKFIVVPSLCDEVCNMAIIESICLKRPVLAVNLGGNTELSKLDKSVLIYDFKNSKDTLDKINYLMYDNKLTNNINNIFTSAHYYENLVKVYNNALTVNN
jgi:glycosyltransferase involved in cell wall biosynthesis